MAPLPRVEPGLRHVSLFNYHLSYPAIFNAKCSAGLKGSFKLFQFISSKKTYDFPPSNSGLSGYQALTFCLRIRTLYGKRLGGGGEGSMVIIKCIKLRTIRTANLREPPRAGCGTPEEKKLSRSSVFHFILIFVSDPHN
jgi:hypothetical protein